MDRRGGMDQPSESVDGGGSKPIVMAFYGKDLCSAEEFYKLMIMKIKNSTMITTLAFPWPY